MAEYLVKSKLLELKVSSKGAEMQSVKVCEKEMLWQGDQKFWRGKAPFLFPVCGALKNKTYTYGDKAFLMPFHGFARDNEFELVHIDESKLILRLTSNDYTKEIYPFDFELDVKYEVKDCSVSIAYEIKNKGNEMYFSFGSHESFNTPGDFNDYSLVFEKEEDFLSSIVIEGGLLSGELEKIAPSGKVLNLNYDLFKHSTLVFAGLNSREVTLKRKGDKVAHFKFDTPNLLIWTLTGAPYVCIEPWQSLPDYDYTNGKIEQKPGVIKLEKDSNFINEHTITYFN